MALKGFKSLLPTSWLALSAMFSLFFMSSVSRAEGFICHSVDQDTRIDVYFDPADPSKGLGPRARTLVISDPTVSKRRSLVARFNAADGLLNNSGNVVVAYVDLKNPNSSRKGEKIGGTVLGSLRSIKVDIDYSYEESVQDGSRLAAFVTYSKTNGEELVQDFDCVRYRDDSKMNLQVLKGE